MEIAALSKTRERLKISKRAMTIDDTEKNRERRDPVRRERPLVFQRGDLARVKGILESSSFISRLTTGRCANAKRIIYIYIYRWRSNNFRLLISDKDNTGRTAPFVPIVPSAYYSTAYNNCNRDRSVLPIYLENFYLEVVQFICSKKTSSVRVSIFLIRFIVPVN